MAVVFYLLTQHHHGDVVTSEHVNIVKEYSKFGYNIFNELEACSTVFTCSRQ
jgi:hypothetical protein